MYQSIVPAPVLAESTILPGPQIVLEVTPEIVGIVFIVATTAVRVAEAHPLYVAST